MLKSWQANPLIVATVQSRQFTKLLQVYPRAVVATTVVNLDIMPLPASIKDAKCHKCGKVDHLQKVCQSKVKK